MVDDDDEIVRTEEDLFYWLTHVRFHLKDLMEVSSMESIIQVINSNWSIKDHIRLLTNLKVSTRYKIWFMRSLLKIYVNSTMIRNELTQRFRTGKSYRLYPRRQGRSSKEGGTVPYLWYWLYLHFYCIVGRTHCWHVMKYLVNHSIEHPINAAKADFLICGIKAYNRPNSTNHMSMSLTVHTSRNVVRFVE